MESAAVAAAVHTALLLVYIVATVVLMFVLELAAREEEEALVYLVKDHLGVALVPIVQGVGVVVVEIQELLELLVLETMVAMEVHTEVEQAIVDTLGVRAELHHRAKSVLYGPVTHVHSHKHV